MKYWIFQALPERFELREKLVQGERDTWLVTRYRKEFQKGDIVYFWRARGEDALYGWGEIESEEPYPAGKDKSGRTTHRVELTYKVRFASPIPKGELRDNSRLLNLHILRNARGTNFRVDPDEAVILNGIIRSRGFIPPDVPPSVTDETQYRLLTMLYEYQVSPTTEAIRNESINLSRRADPPHTTLTSSTLLLAVYEVGRRSTIENSANFLYSQILRRSPNFEGDIYQHLNLQSSDQEQKFRSETVETEVASSASSMPSLITANVHSIYETAKEIGKETTDSEYISARHLVAALLSFQSPGQPTGAQERLAKAGMNLQDLREEFLEFVLLVKPDDESEAWRRILVDKFMPKVFLPEYAADDPHGPDFLDIRTEVKAFASVVAAERLEPPLAIGIFGDWGTGKTFFMNKMIKRVRQIAAAAQRAEAEKRVSSYCSRIVQIEFNAWHYVGVNLWASLVSHIFESLRSAIVEDGDEDSWDRLLAELDEKIAFQQMAEARLRDAEEANEKAKQELEDAHSAFADQTLSLEQIRLGDILSSIDLPVQLKDDIKKAQEELGLTGLVESAKALQEVIGETQTIVGRSRALSLSMLPLISAAGPWRILFSAAIVLIVSFVIGVLVSNFGETELAIVAQITTILSSIVAWISPKLKKASDALSILENANRELETQLHKLQQAKLEGIGKSENELRIRKLEIAEAKNRLSETTRAVEKAKIELKEDTASQRLSRFIQERAASEDYRQHLGIIALIRRDFDKLTKLMLRQGKDHLDPGLPIIDRIILYIDDLDRCAPDRVVEVLRAIHLLLAFPLFVVVVGVDARWVSRSLEEHYPELLGAASLTPVEERGRRDPKSLIITSSGAATSHDYLEKIFQVPFWLKSMDTDSSRGLIEGILASSVSLPSVPASGEQVEFLSEVGDGKDNGKIDEDDRVIEVEEEEIVEAPEQLESANVLQLQDVEEDIGTEPVNLQPQNLMIDRKEYDAIQELTRIMGRSPRIVKRFINLYRFIRARVIDEELAAYVGNEENPGDYHAVLILLAVVNGVPDVAQEFLQEVFKRKKNEPLQKFVYYMMDNYATSSHSGWQRVIEDLSSYARDQGQKLNMEPLIQWAPYIARFSFELETARTLQGL